MPFTDFKGGGLSSIPTAPITEFFHGDAEKSVHSSPRSPLQTLLE